MVNLVCAWPFEFELNLDERAVGWLDQLIAVEPEHAMGHADLVESLAEIGAAQRCVDHAVLLPIVA